MPAESSSPSSGRAPSTGLDLRRLDALDLPVESVVPALRRALADPGVAVLTAEPGAGKTTAVPLRLLDAPWLDGQRIVVLEPRRLATRAAARRMADLVGEPVGETVGFRTRDERRVGERTRIEVVTEGILTAALQRDPSLPGIGLVMFDELHERSLQADLGLALALEARRGLRPDLRLLASSATIDVDAVAALLGDDGPAPVVASEGRTFPVEVEWRPRQARQHLEPAVADAVRQALRDRDGDVLVFLPGAAAIERTARLLGDGHLPDGPAGPAPVDVHRLYGALSAEDQDAALRPAPSGRRKVVLATDIAETSLTVEGVTTVVDGGEARTPRLDPRTGMTALATVAVSKASADQRAGRAGRLGPGTAVRLWSKVEHAARPPFTPAEITEVDLAGFALELARWGTPDPAELPLLDPPPPAALAHAWELLELLGAVDADHRPTEAGRAMARLPLHPRLAAVVVAGVAADVDGPGVATATACALAALLDERDVLRGRPDEVPVDLALRLELLADPGRHHPSADGGALRRTRQRATDLVRRAGGGSRRGGGGDGPGGDGRRGGGGRPGEVDGRGGDDGRRSAERGSGGERGGGRGGGGGERGGGQGGGGRPALDDIRPELAGALLLAGFPDRLAQARGGAGRYRLRTGSGAWLADTDVLAAQPLLVVADLDGKRGDARIRQAAAVGLDDVLVVAGDQIVERSAVEWDVERDDVVVRTERSIDRLVLARHVDRPDPGPEVVDVLVDHVRRRGLDVLGWTPASRSLQHRIEAVRSHRGDSWPDVSDEALLADLDGWLAPLLPGATSRRDLARLDMGMALGSRLDHHQRRELDRLAPPSIEVPSGRRVDLDWSAGTPVLAVAVQELYGTTDTPSVLDGEVPLTVHLLSPAGRPVQITSDLGGFWSGSWTEVRKDLAGGYPKHDWPADPSSATPHLPGRRPRR